MTLPDNRHVVVLGLMGIGKSTTAAALARRLGRPERDSDRDIEVLFGTAGRDFAQEHGVEALHRVEAGLLLGALASDVPSVISAAASVVEDEACRVALANTARVVVLTADLDTIEARARTGDHRRPLPRPELEALAQRRAPYFAAVGDLGLEAGAPTDTLVNQILEAFGFAGRVGIEPTTS